jgi:hypothetical protein
MDILKKLEDLSAIAQKFPKFERGEHCDVTNKVSFYTSPTNSDSMPDHCYFSLKFGGIELTHNGNGGVEIDFDDASIFGTYGFKVDDWLNKLEIELNRELKAPPKELIVNGAKYILAEGVI